MKQEGIDYMGDHPCVFSEIGIPYDMDDKYAYKTGDYMSQTLAMDANHFALEGSGANGFALWTYTGEVRMLCLSCILYGLATLLTRIYYARTITNGATNGTEKTSPSTL